MRLLPEAENDERVHVFEGSLENKENMVDCLRGTRAAFLAVAESSNVPGCSIAYDTAVAVIAALRVLRKQNQILPKLVILSSSSLEYQFYKDMPYWAHKMLITAASYAYKDLERAEALLRDEQSWISNSTWMKPGALSHDMQKGHILSKDQSVSPVSFLDLAAGMVEVADDMSGTYAMSNVSVNPTARNVGFPWDAPMALIKGLLFHFFPWTYTYLA